MGKCKRAGEIPESRGYKRHTGQCFFCESPVWTVEGGFREGVERIILGLNSGAECVITVCVNHKRVRVDKMTNSIARRILQGWASELERKNDRATTASYWFRQHNGVRFKNIKVIKEIGRRVPMTSDPFTTIPKVPLTS